MNPPADKATYLTVKRTVMAFADGVTSDATTSSASDFSAPLSTMSLPFRPVDVIYASLSYAGAMLECLAHAGIGRVPRTHVAVGIAVAQAVAVERHDASQLPTGWDHADLRVARAFGDAWIRERRTAVLVVPSVVARREGNVLINPGHPDFAHITAGAPEAVVWDERLFTGG